MKIFLCGDIMTGRGIDQILTHSVDPQIHESYLKDARKYVALAENRNGKIPRNVSDKYIWGDALSIWKKENPDLRIVNLETAITTNETFVPKGINYRMHPDNTSILSAAGIDVCVLSNNHILDWNSIGLAETIKSLEKNHIKHTGAGLTEKEAIEPAIFESAKGRVLIFSLSHPSSGMPYDWKATDKRSGVFLINDLGEKSFQNVLKMIEKYKKKDDIVIVSIHWGSNWGYDVSDSEIDFAHALIDLAGVDIVHGHSSHHPKPIEIYKGHPIFYGCGDFFNDYEGIGGHEEYRGDLALMYFISFETGPFKLQKIELDCLKIRRFALHRASARDTSWMYETLSRESEPFSIQLKRSEEENVIFVESK